MTTAAFANFAAGLRYEDLPAEAVRATRRVFLDWLGNAYAGAATRTGQIIAGVLSEAGGAAQARLIGFDTRSSAINAALINGATSHVVEFDDIYRDALYHPGSPTIAAALAMAEKLHADGKRLIAGIVAGYEVGTRIGEAVNPSHYRYWHTTGTVGTFGAAAAAGNLLGLNAEQMTWALGNAGTQAAGLWQFLEDGQMMSKPLHSGKAASSGVLSALLAQRGFNGATRILEGTRGFCVATASDWSFDKVLPSLGQQYNIASTTFKAHASCGHTHPAIDATLAIAREYTIRAKDVSSVRVRTYSLAHTVAGNPSPNTIEQAKFSIPFCVATVLRFGKAGTAEFASDRVGDPETVALMNRVSVEPDPELSSLAPKKRPAIVEIVTHDGRSFVHRVDFRKGDPENPPTQSELETKFLDLAAASVPREEGTAITEAVSRLDTIEDVSTLLWR